MNHCTVSQEWLDERMDELGRLRAENERLAREADVRVREVLERLRVEFEDRARQEPAPRADTYRCAIATIHRALREVG